MKSCMESGLFSNAVSIAGTCRVGGNRFTGNRIPLLARRLLRNGSAIAGILTRPQ